MKLKHLTRVIGICFLSLLFNNAFSQVTLPPNFQQNALTAYNNLVHKEETFEKYLQYCITTYTLQSNIANGITAVYNGCDEINTACGNGNFETGLNQAEWDGAFGTISMQFPNADLVTLTEGFSAPGLLLADINARQTIVTAGNDPITGVSMVAPGGSTKALRLGNSVDGAGAELISKRITVSASQTILSFQYATVLQKPGTHPAVDQATFWVRVVDCATGLELMNVCNLGNNSNMVIANQNNPFFTTIQYENEDLVFTQWLCAQINLSQHIGKTVNIQFINEDCSWTGHFGYTYIDNLCTTSNCSTGSMTVARKPDCGPGQICFNYTLPQANGQTGTVQIALNIYQNGLFLQTFPSPVLSSGSSYCFTINPATVTGINENLVGYDFTATANFSINGFTLAPIITGNPPAGQTNGQNNDAQIYCVDQCCPGRNMVRNPGFESGNLYFSTAYNYQPLIGANSVNTGRYTVMTSAQGLTVSPTWNVNCAINGRHLYVNGATGLAGTRIAWFQNVSVERGKTYKFCADMKNLPQCGFDVKPKVNVLFSVPGFNINNQLINVSAGACNWQSVNQVITTPAGSGSFSMGITITLDETGIGDGNDLAIDNITLVEIPQVPQSELLMSVNIINSNGATFGVSIEPVSWPVPKDCGYYWEVAEIDANDITIPGTAVYNPSQWWGLYPNTFIGYDGTDVLSGNNDGIFQVDRKYRIIYGRWCDCEAWNSTSWTYDPKNLRVGEPIRLVKDDKFVFSAEQIAAIINGTYMQTTAGDNKSTKTVKAIPAVEENISTMKIFPNPANDKLTVILPEKSNNGRLTVFNMQGEVILESAIESRQNRRELNTSTLTPGTYIIQFKTTQGEVTAREKFVKL